MSSLFVVTACVYAFMYLCIHIYIYSQIYPIDSIWCCLHKVFKDDFLGTEQSICMLFFGKGHHSWSQLYSISCFPCVRLRPHELPLLPHAVWNVHRCPLNTWCHLSTWMAYKLFFETAGSISGGQESFHLYPPNSWFLEILDWV